LSAGRGESIDGGEKAIADIAGGESCNVDNILGAAERGSIGEFQVHKVINR
jgi:hypothetical protein